MSGRKGGGKVDIGSRRQGFEKMRSSSRREGTDKLGSRSHTKAPVPKARNRPSSSEKNREGQESEGGSSNTKRPVLRPLSLEKSREEQESELIMLPSLEENQEGQEESELIVMGTHGEVFQDWMTVSQYRRQWESLWSRRFGSFEDTTTIAPMRFTEKPPPLAAFPMATLQIFSVKLCETRGNLKLPVDVFGMVAVRDAIDHNRNIIFQRKREDCQTLTQEDPYLVLTGPTRAVMLILSDPVIIEVELWKKGTTESEDKHLSFLVAPVSGGNKLDSCLLKRSYTSKLSTLEFRLGHIIASVEATICVSLIHGSLEAGARRWRAYLKGTMLG